MQTISTVLGPADQVDNSPSSPDGIGPPHTRDEQLNGHGRGRSPSGAYSADEPTQRPILFVQAQHNFLSDVPSALSFNQGDIIEVLTQLDSGWWDGLTGDDRRGWFPSNYVRPLADDEYDDVLATYKEGGEPDEEAQGGSHRNSRILRKWRQSVIGQMRPLSGDSGPDAGQGTNMDERDPVHDGDENNNEYRKTDHDEREFEVPAGGRLTHGAEEMEGELVRHRPDNEDLAEGDQRGWPPSQPGDHDLRSEGLHLGYRPGIAEGDGTEVMRDEERVGESSMSRPMSGNVEDYWLPSLTPDGQICYVNIKTGEQSWEAPGLDEDSSAFSTEQSSLFPSVTIPGETSTSSSVSHQTPTPGPRPVPPIPTRGSSVDPIDTSGANGFRAALDSAVEMNSSGFASYVRKGGDLPAPWVSRMLDDGSGYIYVNQETGDQTEDYAMVIGSRSTNGKSPNIAAEAMRSLGINVNGAKAMPALLRADSSSSRRSFNRRSSPLSEHSGMDSPRLRTSVHSLGKSVLKRLSSTTSSSRGHRASAWEADTLAMLSSELDVSPQASRTISDHQNTVMRRVMDIVVASEAYVAACASGSGGAIDPEAEEILAVEAAQHLRSAVGAVIPPVRRLMHACRFAILGLPEEVYRSFEEGDTDAGRRRALSHLSGESVHGFQRRVIAALSKIVFFCHSAVGMDWPFPGSAERVGADAKELQRSLSLFVGELRKSGCLVGNETESQVMRGLKSNTGHLQLHEEGLVDRFGTSLKKREWRRFDEASVQCLRTGLARQVSLEDAKSATVDGSGQPLRLTEGYEGLSRWFSRLEDLDVPVGLDLDGPSSSRASRGSAEAMERYKATVTEAAGSYTSYERHVQKLQDLSAVMLMVLTCDAGKDAEQRTLVNLQQVLRELDEDLIDLLEISQDQAMLSNESGIKGRTGKRSIRIAERERVAKTVRSSSRHSSLNSDRPDAPNTPASDVHKPLPLPPSGSWSTDRVRAGLNGSTSQDSLNKSQVSLASRQHSGQQTPGSRRSSTSGQSWTQQEAESLSGSVRQSIIGRVPFFRTRSASTLGSTAKNGKLSPVQDSKSKMKLQKLLGEEEFNNTAPVPQPQRIQAVPSPPLPPPTPTYLKSDSPEGDLIMHADGMVKAGTLPALVERLTMHQSLDAAFNSTFLMTYRSFTTAQEVFDLLCRRYEIQPMPGLDAAELEDWEEKKMKPVKLRVFNTLKTWVDQHFIESADIGVLDQIHDYAVNVMALDKVKMPIVPLVKAVQRRQHDGDAVLRKRLVVTANMPPTPLIPKISSGKPLQLLDINPIELARQLTIVESQLYAKIRPIDCLDKAWSEQDAPEKGPNIRAMILNSNRIAAWVGEAILGFTDIKRRSAIFKHWILTADHCRALHNYSTMMAIMAGLNSGPIYRLSRTKNMLSTKTMALFDDMDRIMQTQKNYATYREILKALIPPCTPFLGVYLQFLTFIADGNADTIPCPTEPNCHLIHFFKRQKTADIIREIQQYQLAPYTLSAIQPIITYIESSLENAERAPDPWEQSQKMEPREREDEKLARMLRESAAADAKAEATGPAVMDNGVRLHRDSFEALSAIVSARIAIPFASICKDGMKGATTSVGAPLGRLLCLPVNASPSSSRAFSSSAPIRRAAVVPNENQGMHGKRALIFAGLLSSPFQQASYPHEPVAPTPSSIHVWERASEALLTPCEKTGYTVKDLEQSGAKFDHKGWLRDWLQRRKMSALMKRTDITAAFVLASNIAILASAQERRNSPSFLPADVSYLLGHGFIGSLTCLVATGRIKLEDAVRLLMVYTRLPPTPTSTPSSLLPSNDENRQFMTSLMSISPTGRTWSHSLSDPDDLRPHDRVKKAPEDRYKPWRKVQEIIAEMQESEGWNQSLSPEAGAGSGKKQEYAGYGMMSSPTTFVLSGTTGAAIKLIDRLRAKGLATPVMDLHMPAPYSTPLMRHAIPEFREALKGCSYSPDGEANGLTSPGSEPKVTILHGMTGEVMDTSKDLVTNLLAHLYQPLLWDLASRQLWSSKYSPTGQPLVAEINSVGKGARGLGMLIQKEITASQSEREKGGGGAAVAGGGMGRSRKAAEAFFSGQTQGSVRVREFVM